MKRMTCEMCGSTDLIKQDGVFVCQSCGCKYSAEEAKKIMIDGMVDVQGNVKIDVSDKIKNLYILARRARNAKNNNEIIKYYEQIILEAPNDWEANFFYEIAKIKESNNELNNIGNIAELLNKSMITAVGLINEFITERKEKLSAFREVQNELLVVVPLLINALNRYCRMDDNDSAEKKVDRSIVINCWRKYCKVLYDFGDLIEDFLKDDVSNYDMLVNVWKCGVQTHNKLLLKILYINIFNKDDSRIINIYEQKITQYCCDDKDDTNKDNVCSDETDDVTNNPNIINKFFYAFDSFIDNHMPQNNINGKSLLYSWFMMVLFFPYGLYLFWKNGYKKSFKYGLIAVIIIMIIHGIQRGSMIVVEDFKSQVSTSAEVEKSKAISLTIANTLAQDLVAENADNYRKAYLAVRDYENNGGKDDVKRREIFKSIRSEFENKYKGKDLNVEGTILEKRSVDGDNGTKLFVVTVGKRDVEFSTGTKNKIISTVDLILDGQVNQNENQMIISKDNGTKIRALGEVDFTTSKDGNLHCYFSKLKSITFVE